jgi:glycogen synthase
MKIAGFTFIRNAVQNDYPIVEAIEAFYFTDFYGASMLETLTKGLQDYQVNDKKLAIQACFKQFDWSVAAASYVKVYAKLANRM